MRERKLLHRRRLFDGRHDDGCDAADRREIRLTTLFAEENVPPETAKAAGPVLF